MTRTLLQRMVENLGAGALPTNWVDFDLATFSRGRTLWDFQQKALQNGLIALWKYYSEADLSVAERKQAFMKWYEDYGLEDDLSIRLDRSTVARRSLSGLLETYYTADEQDRLPYEQFINRISFWMATGSGKTLVIVKWIECLRELMRRGEIPVNDILVLTYREDLLEQLREHVNDYNLNGNLHIRLCELRDYPEVKRQPVSLLNNEEIRVFFYRSDNLSDEQKEKIIDFRSYDNNGNWYLLLDEAHKGDKEDAKSQQIFSILTRNGFLFNFSATFTDTRDITTTVYNYNLAEFISHGHGKHIVVLNEQVTGFRGQSDFSADEKQKEVLKALIMLAYTRQVEARVRSARADLYHRPLMMTLVNSVNTEDADLKLFFREMARIGKGEIDDDAWNNAKSELFAELASRPTFEFENDRVKVDVELYNRLTYKDILRDVFNSASLGEIEIIARQSDRKEIALQLVTGDNPFALIRIGDVTDWLKNELSGYSSRQRVSDDAFFTCLNKSDSDINILLGSRSFYEGWDSNRPNVIMYINIGVSEDAKKFILQSVGRGVRIEPFKHQRKRIRELAAAAHLSLAEMKVFNQVKDDVQPLETVYIFGTNKDALIQVISELKKVTEKSGEQEIALEVNQAAVEGKLLLIPTYHQSGSLVSDKRSQSKFMLTEENAALLEDYVRYLDDDRVFFALHGTTPRQIGALREAFTTEKETIRKDGVREYKNLSVLVLQALRYFGLQTKEFKAFKELEDEINHFRHIKVSIDVYAALEIQIKRLMDSEDRIKMHRAKFDAHQITLDQLLVISRATPTQEVFSHNNIELEIKKIANHYYLPVLLSRSEQIDYIRSVIRIESEVRFLRELERYLDNPDNKFTIFDWWLFSKVDENADDITIPYYNPALNKVLNFRPDFIFWLKRGNRYHILFVDPKGTGRTEYEHKVDGFRQIFEENGSPKVFIYQGLSVTVHLLLVTTDRNITAEFYRNYWYDEVEKMVKSIL